jgi:tetratricopeptide (TPR) repeat protein
MTKPPSLKGGRTLADGLREDLSQCEKWVLQIGTGVHRTLNKGSADRASDATRLLRLLDHVANELERLEQRGVDLRAERGRLEGVLMQLRRREKALVTQMGPLMAKQRPADARWWWYLDEQVAAGRRRALKRGAGTLLVGLGVLTVLYLLYDRFLALPQPVRQANTHFFQGEQSAVEGNPTRAIESFETVTALDPGYVEAHLWLGVLYHSTREPEKAEAAFEQARVLFETEAEFLFQRGLVYLTVNDVTAAEQDARAVIDLAPDRPEAYFLLGSVAEQIGDLELASASFQRTSELAEETRQLELQATARLRLANVLQRQMTLPEP